jgi:hypothetical protein
LERARRRRLIMLHLLTIAALVLAKGPSSQDPQTELML